MSSNPSGGANGGTNKDNTNNNAEEKSFFGHLDDLRPHLVRGFASVFVFFVAAFCLRHYIIDVILFGPQSPDFPTNRFLCMLAQKTGVEALCINPEGLSLINTRLGGQFGLHMMVSLATAIALAVPYLLWEIWRFVRPALTAREQHGSQSFVFYVSLCFFTGLLFGYFIIAPMTISFLGGYTASEYITNMIDANSYLSAVLGVSLACAAVFQLPLLVYFLTRMGIISAAFLKRYRKHAIVVLALLSAIITPPDALSMTLVLIPMYALFEFSISLARRVEKRKAAAENR